MTSVVRRPIAAANWKMNLLRRDAEFYCATLRERLAAQQEAEVVIFPSFPLVPFVAQGLAGSVIACGGQDLHPEASGAHTGDVSGPQLRDAGCSWVLCGHSERRRDHGESYELVGRKAQAARQHGLMPLICIGETRDQRRAGRTFEVLRWKLAAAVGDAPSDFEIAYEPVGTSDRATPEIAQEAHAFLRRELARLVGDERAAAIRILYGGSVNPDNAVDLIAKEDIDGFVVGSASCDCEKFLAVIAACVAPG